MTEAFDQEPKELEQWLDFIEEDMGNVRRAISFCEENSLDASFKVHAKSETAAESAENVGVDLEQIVKTLVFKAGDDFVAVLCPGSERVSEEKLESLTGEDVRMANPEEVKENTGYVIGGVSPFDLEIDIYMHEPLVSYKKVKPAAGSRVVGVELDPEDLRDAIDAETADISED